MGKKSNWSRIKILDERKRFASEVSLKTSIDKHINKPTIPFCGTFSMKNRDPAKQAPVLSQQELLNKQEKSRRNNKPVTLPSFKCLEES